MISQKELKEKLYGSLRELGLTEHEISLYVLSLHLGPTSISNLARHLAISRPNVYKVITGLEKHNLARFSQRQPHMRTFVVEPPTVITELLRNKASVITSFNQEIISAMPNLLALYHQGESPTKIKIIKGKEQFIKIFYQTLDEENEIIEFFGDEDEWTKFIGPELEAAWIKERIRRGIRINLLLTPSEKTMNLIHTAKEELREVRIFKGEERLSAAVQIYANKVILWQPQAMLLVLIEDECIVKMMRSMFYNIWDNSPRAEDWYKNKDNKIVSKQYAI